MHVSVSGFTLLSLTYLLCFVKRNNAHEAPFTVLHSPDELLLTVPLDLPQRR